MSKISKMKANITEVQAERNATKDKEYDYRMKQEPITKFPFTHGDTVEAARAQIKGEMVEDLRKRDAIRENMKKERFDSSGIGQIYQQGLPSNVENDINLYPQGGNDRVLLRDKFQQSVPFYLRENKPTIFRKVNEERFDSAMSEARTRFEQKLREEKTENQKNINEFHAYMDETSKF